MKNDMKAKFELVALCNTLSENLSKTHNKIHYIYLYVEVGQITIPTSPKILAQKKLSPVFSTSLKSHIVAKPLMDFIPT